MRFISQNQDLIRSFDLMVQFCKIAKKVCLSLNSDLGQLLSPILCLKSAPIDSLTRSSFLLTKRPRFESLSISTIHPFQSNSPKLAISPYNCPKLTPIPLKDSSELFSYHPHSSPHRKSHHHPPLLKPPMTPVWKLSLSAGLNQIAPNLNQSIPLLLLYPTPLASRYNIIPKQNLRHPLLLLIFCSRCSRESTSVDRSYQIY